ncbi:hypothetical protein BDR05DRAFT_894131, partial [Suillus weaverae]
VMGYNIGCSYQKTVNSSSISTKAHSNHHHFIVNSFHGHAHNHQCQLWFHPLYQHGLSLEDLKTCKHIFSGSNAVAPVIFHASYFHWLQFINLHFQQWDSDRYLELMLTIIDDLSLTVKEFKLVLNISDGDFKHWNMEELEFLESLTEEREGDIEAMIYVDALQSLAKAK